MLASIGKPSSRYLNAMTAPAPESPAVVELSVVMPCLNEADTVATCVRKAREGLASAGIHGEVIVADNGSTDDSMAIAQAAGARVVSVTERGYGAALMGGIAAARGRFVLMGDADDSYDFREVTRFLPRLLGGDDLVQGCRLPSGGGVIEPGAMPWLHRWFGNPALSWVARRWFRTPIHDIYCGMRAFRKESYVRLSQRCTGMEFATEMIVKASLYELRIGEVPITLHPDGRRSHAPHLRTFRDGWRTVRFFLLCSPRRLFFGPGVLLVSLGLVGYALAMPAISLRGATFDAHTLLFASLAVLTGYQGILYGLFAKVFAASEGLLPADPAITRVRRLLSLERGLVAGGLFGALGLLLLLKGIWIWFEAGFGRLDYASTMRVVVPGVTLTSLGVQTILGAFLLSILELRRR
jgi:glycosyltransferase involved in cell wall biosynthesis